MDENILSVEELKKIMDRMAPKEPILVGITFSVAAWSAIQDKVDKEIGYSFTYKGISCYTLTKQRDECIGWFNAKMMFMYIQMDDCPYITELPTIEEFEKSRRERELIMNNIEDVFN